MDPEEPFEVIQMHHVESPSGEAIFIDCPHCGKKILVEFKALELDQDSVEVYWGKNPAEIRRKRKKAEAKE